MDKLGEDSVVVAVLSVLLSLLLVVVAVRHHQGRCGEVTCACVRWMVLVFWGGVLEVGQKHCGCFPFARF